MFEHKVLCPYCLEVHTQQFTKREWQCKIEKGDIGYGSKLTPSGQMEGLFEPEHLDLPMEENWCNTCSYWIPRIIEKDDPCSIRIDGHQYWMHIIPPNYRGGGFLPFGGRKFSVRRKGETEVHQIMMWDNADIPEQFRDDLPDNWEWAQ